MSTFPPGWDAVLRWNASCALWAQEWDEQTEQPPMHSSVDPTCCRCHHSLIWQADHWRCEYCHVRFSTRSDAPLPDDGEMGDSYCLELGDSVSHDACWGKGRR